MDQRLLPGSARPFDFWLWDSGFTKSWPSAYFINWIASLASEYHLHILKNLLLIAHIANALMIYLIHKQRDKTCASLASVFFLVHPFHFLTLGWTFQVFTTLSVFLILLLIRLLQKNTKATSFKAVIVYYLSLSIKSLGMALVLLPLLKSINSDIKIKQRVLLFLSFATVSLYFYYMLNIGIFSFFLENRESRKLVPSVPTINQIEIITPQNSQLQPIEDTLSLYEKSLVKVTIVANNFWYYLKNSLFFSEVTLFQKKDTTISITTFFSVFIFLFLLGIFFLPQVGLWTQLLRWQLGAFLIVFGFLPISGISYVPNFKHSFTSAHWSYLFLVGISFIFYEVMIEFKKRRLLLIPVVFIGLLLVQQIHARTIFSNRSEFMKKNLEVLPHHNTLQHLLDHELKMKKDSL